MEKENRRTFTFINICHPLAQNVPVELPVFSIRNHHFTRSQSFVTILFEQGRIGSIFNASLVALPARLPKELIRISRRRCVLTCEVRKVKR